MILYHQRLYKKPLVVCNCLTVNNAFTNGVVPINIRYRSKCIRTLAHLHIRTLFHGHLLNKKPRITGVFIT